MDNPVQMRHFHHLNMVFKITPHFKFHINVDLLMGPFFTHCIPITYSLSSPLTITTLTTDLKKMLRWNHLSDLYSLQIHAWPPQQSSTTAPHSHVNITPSINVIKSLNLNWLETPTVKLRTAQQVMNVYGSHSLFIPNIDIKPRNGCSDYGYENHGQGWSMLMVEKGRS